MCFTCPYRVVMLCLLCVTSFGSRPPMLTTDEAVYLALKRSPQAIDLQLTKQLNHNAYVTTLDQYVPKWTMSGALQHARAQANTYQAGFSVHQTFRSGATLDASWQPKTDLGPTAQLTIKQPLLRGFHQGHWAIDNATDSYRQQQLTELNGLNDLIAKTLQAYWAVIQAKQSYAVQQLGFKQVQQTFKRYQIKVNAGQLARASLIEQKGQLVRYQLGLETQKNNINAAIKNLLSQLGLPESSNIRLDEKLHVEQFFKLPKIKTCLALGLKANADIQMARLGVTMAVRNKQIAQDNLRPQLDVTGQTGQAHQTTVDVQWSVPLGHKDRHAAWVASDVAYRQAKQALKNAIRNNRRDILNIWHTLKSKQAQIDMQAQTLELSRKNYDLVVKKNRYGMASALDVTIKQQAVTTDQQTLINLKIAYLTDYITLLRLQGRLLAQWYLKYKRDL